ncbi:MAG: AI-2E family transporter [Wenzhouxiangellaceae bacterium]|nr:AI-2E family transporter [Wenzhouxiangellaceae bacterium]
MFAQIREWYHRNFSDPQVVILALLLLAGVVLVMTLGQMLAPVFASIIVAYLLEGMVARLESFGIPRLIAVLAVFSGFMALLLVLFFGITPMITRQVVDAARVFPDYISQLQAFVVQLPERYPQIVGDSQVNDILESIRKYITEQSGKVVSPSGLIYLIGLVVFLVLMPILVFFFLKDKDQILAWFRNYLPRNRALAMQVWQEVDAQIGNYVRGKVLEILIVWVVTYATFALLGLPFAMLISMLVGFSVLIPYIGAAVVTIPVAIVAFIEFGFTMQFAWVMIAYAIIQLLDGNVLVPVLFSEVVSLHPVAIIIAVLVFGGIWGFWGVFFAIPLATLVNAVLRAWPRGQVPPHQRPESDPLSESD